MSQNDSYQKYEQFYHDSMKLWMMTGKSKECLLKKYKLTWPEIRILYMISLNPEVTTSHIAETMSNSTSAITQIVDQLVAKKLLKRINSVNDRRKVFLSITKLGENRFHEFKAVHLQALEKLLTKLSDEELDTLIKLQLKIIS
jgi:MarR family transcriptional regulator, organic hydroperoxide resistance regulator